MNRSIRCPNGFDRSLVACPECGDHDADSRAELRNNAKRKPVTNPHGRQAVPRRDRLYAVRERRAGR